MHLRNKRTGAIISAALELCPDRGSGTHFAIRLWLPDGNCRLIGRMESAIGYELIAWSKPELAALVLAGFRIGRVETKTKPSTLLSVAKLLHLRPRKRPARARTNGKGLIRKNGTPTTTMNNRTNASNGINAGNWHQPADGTMTRMVAGS